VPSPGYACTDAKPISAQIPPQLFNLLREIISRAVKRPRRARIAAESPPGARPSPRSMRSGKSDSQRSKLFGNHQRRMIRQHDAAGAHANSGSSVSNVPNQHGSSRARHSLILWCSASQKRLYPHDSACCASARELWNASAAVPSMPQMREIQNGERCTRKPRMICHGLL